MAHGYCHKTPDSRGRSRLSLYLQEDQRLHVPRHVPCLSRYVLYVRNPWVSEFTKNMVSLYWKRISYILTVRFLGKKVPLGNSSNLGLHRVHTGDFLAGAKFPFIPSYSGRLAFRKGTSRNPYFISVIELAYTLH